jgi:hypothetical protein
MPSFRPHVDAIQCEVASRACYTSLHCAASALKPLELHSRDLILKNSTECHAVPGVRPWQRLALRRHRYSAQAGVSFRPGLRNPWTSSLL